MDRIELELSRIGVGLGKDWVRFEPGLGQKESGLDKYLVWDWPGLGQDKTRIETGLENDWARIEQRLGKDLAMIGIGPGPEWG